MLQEHDSRSPTESQRSRLEHEWELDFALQLKAWVDFAATPTIAAALEAASPHPHHIPELAELGQRRGPSFASFNAAWSL
jgi:hypothetical protein